MYSTYKDEMAKARIGDMHQAAQREALARAALAPKQPSSRRALRLPFFAARRLLTVLGARARRVHPLTTSEPSPTES
jgi:hypothetical protein